MVLSAKREKELKELEKEEFRKRDEITGKKRISVLNKKHLPKEEMDEIFLEE